MITCVSSNTQKSFGNHANQDEKEQSNASINNSSNDANNINFDNKTESKPQNENILPEKNKSNLTEHASANNSSLIRNAANENEKSIISCQVDQENSKIPQSSSNKSTSQSLNSSKIPNNSVFPEMSTYYQNFSKPIGNTSQSSEYGLNATNHQPDEEEDDSEPVLDLESDIGTLRSNSFRDIKSMVPRGYGKMGRADLTKTDSEASFDHINFNNSGNNENSSENSTKTSQHTSHMLDEMRQRHAAAWKILGYDPTHGKGDMRGSVTLANFSPLKLIRQSKLFAQNGCSRTNISNNNQNSIPKQVMQSYSLCIKPAYRTMKRVNSSNGPLSNLVDENCGDLDEDENQAFNSPFNDNNQQSKKKKEDDEDDFIPPSIMTAESLLNGPDFFKDDDSEEYLVVEEEEEEEEFEEEEFEEEEEGQINNNDNLQNGEISQQNSNENKQKIDKTNTEPKNTENLTDLEKQTKK